MSDSDPRQKLQIAEHLLKALEPETMGLKTTNLIFKKSYEITQPNVLLLRIILVAVYM